MRIANFFLVAALGFAEDWPTWGGRNRDFIVNTSGIADSWPANGPKKLWTKPLGDGYSSIAVENGILYTAFRRSGAEVIVAMEAATGRTIWEYGYPTRFVNDFKEKVGPGPYAMPQVIGDRVVTASALGLVHSLDKKTGKVIWKHDLYNEFHGSNLIYGYSSHALPYKDTLIFLAGGEGDAAIAFRERDGVVVWKSLQFGNAYVSPLLIDVDGRKQVVGVSAKSVFGFDPENGKLLWTHPHETPYGLNVSTPVWGPGNLLFVGSAYGVGARVLEVHGSDVKEVWRDPHFELHWGSVIQRNGWLYFVSGYNGPALLSAVEMKTGKIGWRERGFAKAELLWADGKFILSDEDGTLALLRLSPEKMEVLAKAQVMENISWSVPALVGTKLYLRDRKNIVALELGK